MATMSTTPLASSTSKANTIAGVTICMAFAYMSVILRFLSRRVGRLPVGRDDYTIVLALATTTALCVLVLIVTTAHHQSVTLLKIIVASRVLTLLSIFITKLFILLLYSRIFTSRKFNKVLLTVGAFVAAFTIAAALVNIFQCTPIKALWEPSIPHTCVNLPAMLKVISVEDVLTDVLILCLPLPMVWQLKMSTKLKWQITGMFLVGGVVCVGGIVRTIISTGMWASIEANLAIVSACLPTYKALLRFVSGRNPTRSTQADSTTDQYARSNLGSQNARKFVQMRDEISMEDLPASQKSSANRGDISEVPMSRWSNK